MTIIHRQAALLLIMSATLPAAPQDIEKRVSDLLARMTMEEKLGQMSQSTEMRSPVSDVIKEQIRKGRWGSFINAGAPADRVEAQRIALKESRLGIPLIFGRDVIHGYRTVVPIPLGQSASWDPELIEQAAHVAALEASTEGIHWTFAPMIDITRDPRWGRVAETLGEDPYLTSALGVAMVRGFQGKSLSDAGSIAACAKHYLGYGATEGGKDYNTTWIPEMLLRDVFLPPFRAVRDAGVATFMTSFNALNGIPASGNEFTLRGILRKEWNFDGVVVSDYTAISEMIPHGYAADSSDAAKKAAIAGVDMEMVSTTYFDHLKSLVDARQVTQGTIDEAVRNILRLKFRLGLFDKQPAGVPLEKLSAEGARIARQLATESAVLLKNDGNVLPLAKTIGKVAVIGPLADSGADQMGTWAMDGRADEMQTPLTALRQMLGNDRVMYAPGLKNSRDISHDGFAAAIDAARSADAVLLFLGEEQILSGEAHARAFLNLPGAQEALVSELAKLKKPTVAIIMAGRPLTFHNAAASLNSILFSFHPGMMGGPAMADLLFGQAVPSGKLTITFPRTVGQIPIYYSHQNTGRPPSPGDLGIPMGDPVDPKGYVSNYLDVDFTPEYPFGFGLSYSSFDYSNLKVSSPAIQRGDSVVVSATVANTGKYDADEVVQLYIRDLVASVVQPVRKLRGFQRLHFKAGEKRAVSFTLTTNDLAFYNQKMQFAAEPGLFNVWVAPDSTRGVQGEFRLQ